jgi:hypothetical protein
MSNNNNINDFLNMNNTFNNAKNTFLKMDTKAIIVLIAVGIIFIVFVGFMVYIYYQNFSQNKIQDYLEVELLDYMHECDNNPLVIEPALIPASTLGNEYSLNFWIYITDLKHFSKNSNHLGNVLMRGLGPGTTKEYYYHGNPGIFMDTNKNNLVFCFKPENIDNYERPSISDHELLDLQGDEYGARAEQILAQRALDTATATGTNVTAKQEEYETKNLALIAAKRTLDEHRKQLYEDGLVVGSNKITLNNVPLQRWTCINVSVFNQNVDIYLDGKLKTSKFLEQPPIPVNTVPMVLGPHGGFDGYLSRIKFSNKALNPSEIYQRYKEGPRITKSLKEGITDFFSKDEN